MTTNSSELLDVMISVQVKLKRLNWVQTHDGTSRIYKINEPRLLWWAISAVEASGRDPQLIFKLMEERPPERHWWILRQFLPDGAWYALDRKLDKELEALANVDSRAG